ncbi:MAG: ASCH domain-containing protein, partial [bacterium]|nr:ASCH domain-containing protein [bacterium]
MNQSEIDHFWADAKIRGGLNPIRGIAGPSISESVPPPAFAFGAEPGQATRLAEQVLEGQKTATAGLLAEYEALGEELPAVGALAIILDGASHPRALIRTTAVTTVPFNEVDEEHALLEGLSSITEWRRVHRDFFTHHPAEGVEFTEDAPVVLERFEVLSPPEAR